MDPVQPIDRCPTCGAERAGRFCASCGEKRSEAHDYSVVAFLEHALEGLTHLDGKLPRTLRAIARPGLLTAERLRGARVRWMKPFQLFLLVNVVYFFVQPWTGFITFTTTLEGHFRNWYGVHARHLAEGRERSLDLDHDAFAKLFDHASTSRAKLLIALMIPLLAAVLALVQRRRRRPFGEHLLLATEYMTFHLIVQSMLFPLAMRALELVGIEWYAWSSGHWPELFTGVVASLIAWWFFAVAFRRVHADTLGRAIAMGFLATAGFWLGLFTYRAILFFVTLATI